MGRISVRLTPRGGRDAIDGWSDGAVLRVRVSSAPVEGAANEALVRLIAKVVGVAPSTVRIVSGAQGRTKVVEIAALTEDEVRARVDTHLTANERGR